MEANSINNVNNAIVETENNSETDKVTEADISKALNRSQKEENKKKGIVNKRINFDKKALRRIETMIPVYSTEEAGGELSSVELYSLVIQKAINSLFEGEFQEKIKEI